MRLNAFVQTSGGLLGVVPGMCQRACWRAWGGGFDAVEEVGERLQISNGGVGGGPLCDFAYRRKRHTRPGRDLPLGELFGLQRLQHALVERGRVHGFPL